MLPAFPIQGTRWATPALATILLVSSGSDAAWAAASSGPPAGRVTPDPSQTAPAEAEEKAPEQPAPTETPESPAPAEAPERPTPPEAPERPADRPAARPADQEPEEAPPKPPGASPDQPPAAAPPVSPPTAPAPEEAKRQDQAQQRYLPPVQRPELPVEATPIPGEVVPAAPLPDGDIDLVYVPGFRFILSGHRENYFLSGVTSDQHRVKFQYSAKFDLWPNATRHSAYFGFTQKSLWRLWDFSDSSPFDESNYAPELFYGFFMKLGDLLPTPGTVTTFLELVRIGFEHESNGERLERSRSWNRFYATARAGAYFGTDHYLAVYPRLWSPAIGDGDNEDIEAFLGYGNLNVEYGFDPAERHWYGGGNLGVTMWKGWSGDWGRRGIEVALQWRPGYEGKFVEWWKFTPYFCAQLFHGYGETLLTYDQKITALRIGISFEDRVNWVTLPKR